MKLSIIIVNYNGIKYLKQCISSIQEFCKDILFEIIVVDNASYDDSLVFLKSLKQSNLVLIENKINLGFAKANNIGASHSKGEYILLLNNDTILQSNLKPIFSVFEQKNIGAAGIKMLGKNMEYRHSAGNFPSAIRLLKLKKLFKTKGPFKEGGFKNDLYYVDWVEGSFLLTTKSIWVSVGGLDEDYFMYVEDIDYSKKISKIGLNTVYLPNFSYIHIGGYGSSRKELLKKGLILYIQKHILQPNKLLYKINLEFNFLIKDIKHFFNYKK